jgi:hypothetical protein
VTSASDGGGRRVAAPLNRCAVQADARTVHRQTAVQARSVRDVIARPRRQHRAPTAVTLRAWPTPRSDEAATPRGPARIAPAASGHPWPSPLNSALRPGTLGLLPRDCVHPLRACTKPCPAGVQRVRWSCTPCTPAAPLNACSPHPRVARMVRALLNLRRARSRGYRRPCDITRDYAAHLLCVQARHAPSMAHEIPRPRNPSLCHMAASASLRSARLPRIHARHCWRPARAARVCAPSLACCSVAACGGCARGQRCGSGRSVAARSRHIAAPRVRPLNRCAVQADREPGAASVRRLEARSQSGKAVSRERARSNSQSKSSQREVP